MTNAAVYTPPPTTIGDVILRATDISKSSSAVTCVTTSPWRSQCSGPMRRAGQCRPSTSNISNIPVVCVPKKRTARKLPWA